MSLLAMTMLVVGQKWRPDHTIQGYRPILVPAITTGATFRGSIPWKRGVKQYAEIISSWQIAKPVTEVKAALTKEFGRKPTDEPNSSPFYSFDKPDRRIRIQLWEQGRFVKRGADGKPVIANDTVLSLTEEPYFGGPEPKNWPRAARNVLPRGWLPPLAELDLPDRWSSIAPPSGLPVYELAWFLDQDTDVVAARVAKRIPGWRRSATVPPLGRILGSTPTKSSGVKGLGSPYINFKNQVYVLSAKDGPKGARTRLVMIWLNPRELPPNR